MSESGDVPALNIYDGVYNFFITNHLSMSLVAAVAVVLTFMYVANRVKPSGEGAGSPTRRAVAWHNCSRRCARSFVTKSSVRTWAR